MGRRGDQEAEPGRQAPQQHDPGLPPLGRVRHHPEPRQVPQRGRPGRLEVRPEDEVPGSTEGGQAANGSSGVATAVKDAEGAIGYFELSYATASKISTVKLNTGASAPVDATTENASKAIAAAKIKGTGNDLALGLDYKTKVEGAYPIVLVTYEIACDKGNKADSLATLKAFLTYTASEEGQKVLPDAYYAPLPAEIAAKVRAIVPTLS